MAWRRPWKRKRQFWQRERPRMTSMRIVATLLTHGAPYYEVAQTREYLHVRGSADGQTWFPLPCRHVVLAVHREGPAWPPITPAEPAPPTFAVTQVSLELDGRTWNTPRMSITIASYTKGPRLRDIRRSRYRLCIGNMRRISLRESADVATRCAAGGSTEEESTAL